MKYVNKPSTIKGISRELMFWLEFVWKGRILALYTTKLNLEAVSVDPTPATNNNSVIWQSNGTGTGDDGDIMMSITDSGGTTKTTTLVDFSAI